MNKTESDGKWCTNPSTFFKIPPQIHQNGAQERSRRRPRKRVGEMSVTFLRQMSPSLRNGRFWPPFCDSAGRQAVPKIHFFGTKSSQNLKKWAPEWSIRANMNFWLNFNVKKWDFECAEPTGLLYINAFRWLALTMTKSRNSFRTQSVTAAPKDLRPIQGKFLCVRFALIWVVVDSMRDAGWSWPSWALFCIREPINGKSLTAGVESQSGICSKLVCDIHILLLMLGHCHGPFL